MDDNTNPKSPKMRALSFAMDTMTYQERAEAISELIKQDRENQKLERINSHKARIAQIKRKPTHGNCCTCQDCGQPHDECTCNEIEYIQREINSLGSTEHNSGGSCSCAKCWGYYGQLKLTTNSEANHG